MCFYGGVSFIILLLKSEWIKNINELRISSKYALNVISSLCLLIRLSRPMPEVKEKLLNKLISAIYYKTPLSSECLGH